MLTFKNMHIEVYKRENGEPMCSLQAQDDRDAPRLEGIRYLSFYFEWREFRGLLDGTLSAVNDLGHNVRRVMGGLYTFFDMDFPRDVRGTMQVPFVNVNIPPTVAQILLRAVKATLNRCVPGGDRLRIEIPWETRERWIRQYGQGTGRVTWEMDDFTRDEYEDTRVRSETFDACMANLQRIASNTTWRHTDQATVVLHASRNGREFGFAIRTPRGRITLNGGVIDHGRDGGSDWSTHT